MAAGIANERCLAFAVVRCSGAVWPARIYKQKAGQRSIWTIRKADDGQFGGKSMMPNDFKFFVAIPNEAMGRKVAPLQKTGTMQRIALSTSSLTARRGCLWRAPSALRPCIGTMNPPLTPPRRGTEIRG